MAARLNKAVKQSVSLLSVSKQWGNHSAGNNWDMSYPLSFTVECFVVVANDMSSYDKSFQYIGIQNLQKDKFHMYTSGSADLQIGYIAIGK